MSNSFNPLKAVFLFAFLSANFYCFSQNPITKETPVAFAKTITEADLEKHLSILASDEYGGRETGTPTMQKTYDYIANYFQSLGLPAFNNNSYFQTYPLYKQEWAQTSISINNKEYKFLEDFYCFKNSNNDLIESSTEIVFAGYGIADEKYNDYDKVDVNGKFILVIDGEPMDKEGNYFLTGSAEKSVWSKNWRTKLGAAKEHGAKGILICMDDIKTRIDEARSWITSSALSLETSGQSDWLNNFYISSEMANSLLSSSKKNIESLKKKIDKKNKPLSFSSETSLSLNFKKENQEVEANNVLGYLEGSDLKDEIVFVTAHMDHLGTDGEEIYNGADDDGSGTAGVLEIAQAFVEATNAGYSPRRSLVFMTFSGEEKGLLGSEYYSDHPVFPLENTVADLNIDMIGRVDEFHQNDSDYVYIIGSNFLSDDLHAINEQANSEYTHLTLDYKYNNVDDPNRYYFRSDHYNFAKHDVPIIFYFNGTHEDYHQPTDEVGKINFDLLAVRAQLVFYTAWELVNRNDRIKLNPKKDE